ncbi:MAG: enoyl-CoA hydratase/isomerase family protein [Ramlibacter sp.]|nr:enoyl-CoA hydratase/isomerase family protein [Ramlibacter sp.]
MPRSTANGWEPAVQPSTIEGAQDLIVRQRGAYTRQLQLNRPGRGNAMDEALSDGLITAVATAYADDTKLLVIGGEGKHFCSGFDRGSDDSGLGPKATLRLLKLESLLQLLWRAPFVTVACIHGKALGAGADLAAVCDYRLITRASTFAFPGFRLAGVSLGNRRLAELIGSHAAFDLVLRGTEIDCDSALACGLATGALEREDFDPFIAELQHQLQDIEKASINILREATRASSDGSRDIERLVQSVRLK